MQSEQPIAGAFCEFDADFSAFLHYYTFLSRISVFLYYSFVRTIQHHFFTQAWKMGKRNVECGMWNAEWGMGKVECGMLVVIAPE